MAVSGTSRLLRVTAVWSVISMAFAIDALLTVPALIGPIETATFDGLLVLACSAGALAACTRLWWVATAVAATTLRRSAPTPRWQDSGPLTRWVLLAFGVAILCTTATAVPASARSGNGGRADTTRSTKAILNGLPLPDRPVNHVASHPSRTAAGHPGAARPTAVLLIRPGDTLWAIAAHRLGPGASSAEIAAYVGALYRTNRATIGPDPDLLHPGQALRLPGHTTP